MTRQTAGDSVLRDELRAAGRAGGICAVRRLEGGAGHLRTPQVLAVNPRLLLLEALQPRDDSVTAWEGFAHDLAAMHRGTVHDRFGWHRDGYLGRLRQVNSWTGDGHEFFAQHRLLRYLREPAARQVLTGADRRALKRLCDRLPQIIPAMPAVLTAPSPTSATRRLPSWRRSAASSPRSIRGCRG